MQLHKLQRATREIRSRLEKLLSASGPVSALEAERQWFRIEIPVGHADILHWLDSQSHGVKTYWRDRQSSFEMGGVGQADVVQGNSLRDYSRLFFRLTRFLHKAPRRLRYYGGISFTRKSSKEKIWIPFGAYRFVIPRFELLDDDGDRFLACNFLWENGMNRADLLQQLRTELDQLSRLSAATEGEPLLPLSRSDFPDRAGWNQRIETALNLFSTQKVEKIVLARKALFEFSRNLNPLEFLRRLQHGNWGTYYFCFQPLPNHAFVGNTPERLYKRNASQLLSEAVAGTRPRGETDEADISLEQDLLSNEKDIREHRFVVDSIQQAFRQICSLVEENDTLSVIKLPQLQHLYARIRGKLHSNVDDGQILDCLHPTPAVGGYPTAPALEEIESLEPFDRGWYAGPVGWIGRNSAEFAVAIRSGLIEENRLSLYSGAGIVKGSHAQSEWDEIENKIAAFLNLFQISDSNVSV